MLKKICVVLVCILLCAGCKGIGDFEKGTIDIVKLYDKIEHEIDEKSFVMGMMHEVTVLEEQYGLTSNEVEDFLIYQSILPAQCSEIAIFHVKDNAQESVSNAIHTHISQMREDMALLPTQLSIIEKSQTIELGAYILFVSGEDTDKVIQYISSL